MAGIRSPFLGLGFCLLGRSIMLAQQALVQGTGIEIEDIGTNAVFRTAGNERGFYTAPNLPVGEYEISGELQGFKRAVRSGVTLRVDQKASPKIVAFPTIRQKQGDLSDLYDASGRAITIYDPHTTAANPSGSGFVRLPFGVITSADDARIIQFGLKLFF